MNAAQQQAEDWTTESTETTTLDEQARKDSLKNKRKAKLEERLAKVRQRRNIKEIVKEEKQSDDISNSEDVSSEVKQDSATTSNCDDLNAEVKQEPVSSEPSKSQEPVISAIGESSVQAEGLKDKNKKPVREWDRGKTVFPMQTFVESKRKERESEFAPPAFYYTSSNKDKQGTSQCKQSKSTKNNHPGEITKACENSTVVSIFKKTDPPPSSVELPFVGDGGSMSNYPQYFPNTYEYNAGNVQYAYSDSSYVCPPASQAHYMPTYYSAWSDAQQGTYYNSATPAAAETQQMPQHKRPKLSIIDTRFVRNDNLPCMSDSAPLEVAAVTYTPGSFTAAKQKQLHENTESGQKSQFSSGPLMYAKKEENE